VPAPIHIDHLPEQSRFQAIVDGARCEADYRLQGNVMAITHTGVPPHLQGRGIAAALVQAALDHAQANEWKVSPLCSYARVYMQRHPETLPLLA